MEVQIVKFLLEKVRPGQAFMYLNDVYVVVSQYNTSRMSWSTKSDGEISAMKMCDGRIYRLSPALSVKMLDARIVVS